MPAELEPPELARLVAFSERPRDGDWSLRSALTRYAQPQPQRVSDVLEVVRRIEATLPSHNARLAKEGPAVWSTVATGGPSDDALVGLLQVTAELDALGDVLAAWAVDRAAHEPEAQLDATIAAALARLDELGVAHEARERPPGARSRG